MLVYKCKMRVSLSPKANNAQGICARARLLFFAWSEGLSSHEHWTFSWCQSIRYELSRHTFLVHAVDAVSVQVLKGHGVVRCGLCCWCSHIRQIRKTPHAAVLMCREAVDLWNSTASVGRLCPRCLLRTSSEERPEARGCLCTPHLFPPDSLCHASPDNLRGRLLLALWGLSWG